MSLPHPSASRLQRGLLLVLLSNFAWGSAAAELRSLGIEIDGPTPCKWGERDVLVHDPDGNLLEFAAARPPG